MVETRLYPLIPSSTGESMEEHYKAERIGISYENKIVLDLGASNGDCAEYFLHKGAKFVVAVEGQESYQSVSVFAQLLENSKLFEWKILPIFMFIKSAEQIENLIITYKPDIIKCDIEGAEKYLFEIKDEIWKLVPEYLVETHEGYLHDSSDKLMYEKCEKTNYKIISDTTTIARVIYAKKED